MLLWNGDNGDLLQRFAGHSGSVGGAELLLDGRFLSWDDNSLRLPGDARWAELAISETDGILIEDHTHSRIDELSRELGLRAFGSA